MRLIRSGSIALLFVIAALTFVIAAAKVDSVEDEDTTTENDGDSQETKLDARIDENVLNNLKQLYQHLKDLKILQESMLKFVKTSELVNEHIKSLADTKTDTKTETKSEEREITINDLHSDPLWLANRDAWITMVAAAKANGFDDWTERVIKQDIAEELEEQEAESPTEIETQEPLNIEESEGL